MAVGCDAPAVGSLGRRPLRDLCRVLSTHTRPEGDHFFALWEGCGWVVGGGVTISPRLQSPQRDHLLFGDSRWPRSPSRFWPADHSWCVGTETDFDSTLVGGSAELVAAVPAAPGLDAWPVDGDDSLAHDGDRINR